MSRRCHICQSDLLYERRHFIRHKAIWWEATTQVIKPTYFTQSFPCRSEVQLRANLITHQRSTLRRCTTHICSYLRSRLIRREKFEKFSGSLFKSTTSYSYSVRQFPVWANSSAIILAQRWGYLHNHLGGKIKEKGWEKAILTNTSLGKRPS